MTYNCVNYNCETGLALPADNNLRYCLYEWNPSVHDDIKARCS